MVPYLFLSYAVGKGNELRAIEPIAGPQFPEANPFGFWPHQDQRIVLLDTRHRFAEMEVHHVKLSGAKLAAMPEAERVLLFLLAHASNEINVLTKLILMMRKDEPLSLIVDHVEAGQTFILMRMLIGKLHEAWELFKNRVQSNRAIATTYIPRLRTEAATALKELNRHFGQGSALTAIRNNISFHYSDKENLTEANFQRLPQSEPLQFYLCKTVGNTFYHAAELIAQLGAISLTTAPPADPGDNGSAEARAFNVLCGEIIAVSRDITELFGELIGLLGEDVVSEVITEQITDGPKLSTFSLPFFFDEDDALPVPARAEPSS
jgi:hypothetical protein